MREAFARQLADLEQRIGSELGDAVLTLGEIAEAVHAAAVEMWEAIALAGQRLRRASRSIDASRSTMLRSVASSVCDAS